MAQTKKVSSTPTKTNSSSTATKRQPTVAEMREFQKEALKKELYAKAKQAVNLLDLTKTQTRSYTIYNKENLRSYIQKPTQITKSIFI